MLSCDPSHAETTAVCHNSPFILIAVVSYYSNITAVAGNGEICCLAVHSTSPVYEVEYYCLNSPISCEPFYQTHFRDEGVN